MPPEPTDGALGSSGWSEDEEPFDADASSPRGARKGADLRPEILRGDAPTEILNRLLEGDPLGLAPRVNELLSRQAWMVSSQRAWLRSAARIAYEAVRYRGRPALEQWMDGRIQRALAELVEEQDTEEMRGEPVERSLDVDFYAAMGTATRLEPAMARLACWVLNRQPLAERRVFCAIAFDRLSLEQAAAAGLGTLDSIQRSFQRVTMAMTLAFEERRRRLGLPPDPADPWPESPHAP